MASLNEKMQKVFNDQINAELYASYLYLSMAAYFEDIDLPGFAAWMEAQSQEETGHVMRIYKFIVERNGKVVAIKAVSPEDDLMLISANGILMRTGLDQTRDIGRNTQGVRLIRLDTGDKLVAVARVVKENGKEEQEEETSDSTSPQPPTEPEQNQNNTTDENQ